MNQNASTISLPTGASIQAGDRPGHYYQDERIEIADLLPAAATRVLDVGCGEGSLGKLLRLRGHYVAGIELVPDVAEAARRNLDEVVCADVERASLPFPSESFDALILADVLEHMVDPWRALQKLAGLLKPGAIALASIPNVQNFRIIRDLIFGKWEYTDCGLMDRGHVRFFTYREMVRLFQTAGLSVTHHQCVYRRTAKRRLLKAITFGKAEAFMTRQYLIIASKVA